ASTMTTVVRRRLWVVVALCFVGAIAGAEPAEPVKGTADDAEFFETKVRPILVQRCGECHSDKEPKGGLRVDSRAALVRGGDTGAAVVPGKPAEGELFKALAYGDDGYQMPPTGKLPEPEIAALRQWVERGAPWPTTAGHGGDGPKIEPFDLAARAKSHWAWRPIQDPPVPMVKDVAWPRTPVDRFVLAKLEAAGLTPAASVEASDRATWLRRVTYDIVGLPPTLAEQDAFLADIAPTAAERVVDRLLASPRFGERWGRHWLDLVRFAETRGHEFDYPVPNAWQYRDYVVRAFNADVPYDRFVVEHLAGDLLENPRRRLTDGANESVLGTGFWYLGEWVHSPVDVRQDEVDRVDNMVDVASKTFLAMTVACARCHDHKFDAISARDYYGLAGFVQSTNYRQAPFDAMEANRAVARRLQAIRDKAEPVVRQALAAALKPKLKEAAELLRKSTDPEPTVPPMEAFGPEAVRVVDYSDLRPGEWLTDGATFGPGPTPAGLLRFLPGPNGAP
ncbi:MAG: DUF1549 domain-containing protein, partial [Planctomycetia bacterium]